VRNRKDTKKNVVDLYSFAKYCFCLEREKETKDSELINRMKKSLYKGTDCGAYLHFVDGGIVVGSIVEGSDAEFSRELTYPFSFQEWGWAVQEIENLASEAWEEANGQEEPWDDPTEADRSSIAHEHNTIDFERYR
jgi:hypothetical protein